MPDQPVEPMWRTAGYLAELHPDQSAQLEQVLIPLADDNPVKVSLGMLLGAQFYIGIEYCTRCGAAVHDKLAHGFWHDQLGDPLGSAK